MAWILVLHEYKSEVQKSRNHQVQFNSRLNSALHGLVAGALTASLLEGLWKSSPRVMPTGYPMTPECLWEPSGFQQLQQLGLGHPALLAVLGPHSGSCVPSGRAFGVSLRRELWRFYPLIPPQRQMGSFTGAWEVVYPQACKRVWRACARLLLEMPAVLPYSRGICASPGCVWPKVMVTTSRKDQKHTDLLLPSLVFQSNGLWYSKLSHYKKQEKTCVHASLWVCLPALI